jgi:hypothetical protein
VSDSRALPSSRAVLVSVSGVLAIAVGSSVLVLLTDLPVYIVYAIWIAPLVVLIPYACPPAEKRAYGIWTVAAALVVPTVATVSVVWLVLIRAQ